MFPLKAIIPNILGAVGVHINKHTVGIYWYKCLMGLIQSNAINSILALHTISLWQNDLLMNCLINNISTKGAKT